MTSVTLIGFKSATIIQDIAYSIESIDQKSVLIIEPEDFFKNKSSADTPHIICVAQDMYLRKEIADKLSADRYQRYTFIHSSVVVHKNVTIGAGCFIGPFVTVGSDSIVGTDCLISPYAMISHRVNIGRGVVMQPYAMIAGSSTVGEFCKLNARSLVLDHLSLTEHAELGAGTMVTKNLTEPGFYLGTPARKKI